jgi:hypothetical protein
MDDFHFAIDLPVKSEWANVDLLRTSLQNWFMVMFSDVDGCQAIAMVAGELLENAVKYGHWTGPHGEFRLRVTGQGKKVRVTVENPVKPSDPGVAELMQTIEWIKGFPNVADAYRAKLLQVAAASSESNTSQLGLVRICYEAHCTLTAAVIDGAVQIAAEMSFTDEEAAS